MQTSRRIDQIDGHAAVAERVRKLEVMPNTATLEPARWTPSREDLWAIAGHIYMLGCYEVPTHTSATPVSGQQARIEQASQVLWALLDQRASFGQNEGRQWLLFLKQLGAIPDWNQTRHSGGIGFAHGTDFPVCQLGYAQGGHLVTDLETGDRVIYLAGFPSAYDWKFVPDSGVIVVDSDTGPIYSWDESSIPLWDNPVGGDQWAQIPGVFVGDPDEDPVLGATNHTYGLSTPYRPCGGPLLPPYLSHLFPGQPMPYHAGNFPCPDASDLEDVHGYITRLKLTLPGYDLWLVEPPRLAIPDTRSNSFGHPVLGGSGAVFNVGPGLDWLAQGVEAILGDYPAVSAFYANALPQAYAAKLQHTHYRWQSLPVSVNWRGRVEAHLEGDRVILKGAIAHPGVKLDRDVFYMPEEWNTDRFGYYFATDHTDANIPIEASPNLVGTASGSEGAIDPRRYRPYRIHQAWATAVDYQGPTTLRFGGTVVPRRMTP